MSTYRVSFDRIGRHHEVADLVVATREHELPDKIRSYALQYPMSRDVDVYIDQDAMTGRIVVGGCRPGGSFTVTAEPDPNSAAVATVALPTKRQQGREARMAIGQLIRARRRQLGLTQAQLASRAEVGQGTVSMWEIGQRQPNPAVRARVAAALDLDSLAPGDDPHAAEAAIRSRVARGDIRFDRRDITVLLALLDEARGTAQAPPDAPLDALRQHVQAALTASADLLAATGSDA